MMYLRNSMSTSVARGSRHAQSNDDLNEGFRPQKAKRHANFLRRKET